MDDKRWAMMSLNEKIRWRNRHPVKNSWVFADKILAKDIAKQRAPECSISKVLFIPKKPEDIDINKLPKNYVFKANHGSGWIIKVRDGKNAHTGDIMTNEILITQAKKWLSQMYSHGNERQYTMIEPKVFFEEDLGEFIEYRFFCFDEKIKFIMVDVHGYSGIKSSIYDPDWRRIHVRWRDPEGDDAQKPKNLDKIINIIEKLSADFDFIRIDVYLKDNDVYFGEFTFTPNAGSSKISPPEYDMIWGSYWTHDMADKKELKVPQGANKLSMGSKINSKTRMHRKILSFKIKHKLRKF